MGEYITVDNQEIKIGVCENLYYARFEQLQELKARVEGINEYVDEKSGFRFRFPFPDEDNFKIGAGNYEPFRGIIVTVPYEFIKEVEHNKVCVSTSVNNVYNINHYLQCPCEPTWQKTCSNRPNKAPILIVQQRQIEQKLWTICQCGYCETKFRLSPEKAIELVEMIDDDSTFMTAIKQRIIAGYR